MFSENKTAQMAGYLLLKRGGRMAYINLMKLLYLADREYLLTYGDSMTGERAVSMDNGPILSHSLKECVNAKLFRKLVKNYHDPMG
ncbi:Panacea domain-containing protein [Brenneria izbisi]|uniref:Panacea domain-containing protein n=1 Tax=Brenneria izbisi TaxID=2939450 RepID=A0AA41XWP1_9GAMM|nr:Panacea domain-containing protein [Brenneria izbisi]MCV9877817.1 Panacea domain-containing protein [Brenneria izbisi]MCV9881619.1 Panacea domain-containing protein [Brenneria izbisi]